MEQVTLSSDSSSVEIGMGQGIWQYQIVATMFVGDRMFFGQDRLAFVEAALRELA